MILIHKNAFCNAIYDPATTIVRTEYVGIAQVEAITDLLRKVIDYSGKAPAKHMIANLTRMQGTFTGALPFFEKEFYPSMIANGLESYAMAVSTDVFTQYAASQLRKKVGQIDWHVFSSVKEAEQWTATKVALLV
jgi:hypothetical protein